MGIKQECKNLMQAAIETHADTVCDLASVALVGTAIPGVGNMVLAYRQARQEHMYSIFLREITEHIGILDERLSKLSRYSLQSFTHKYFGMISDYAFEEVQEEKIAYLVKGLINAAGIEDVNENFILNYYDTFRELRILDIAVLKNFQALQLGRGVIARRLQLDLAIDANQYRAIRDKLDRLGLVTTNRAEKEDALYHNFLAVQQYVQEISQNKPNPRLKSLDRLDEQENYKISKYGKDFLTFFSDSY